MTPGINAVVKHQVEHRIHEYTHDPASVSYGDEASERSARVGDSVVSTRLEPVGRRPFCGAMSVITSVI